jgi:hypothetical protein
MNPWPGNEVVLMTNGKKKKVMKGDLLEISTKPGEVVRLSRKTGQSYKRDARTK